MRVTEAIEKFTGRPCFETFRRCLDQERLSTVEYDACDQEFMSEQGETRRHGQPVNLSTHAAEWRNSEPAVKFFLDGSRHTYKIVDMPIGSQVFPIVAGQVGVGVCQRENRIVRPCRLSFKTILAVPDKINHDGGGAKQNAAYCATKYEEAQGGRQRELSSAASPEPTRTQKMECCGGTQIHALETLSDFRGIGIYVSDYFHCRGTIKGE